MEDPTRATHTCPGCGAPRSFGQRRCWLCGNEAPVVAPSGKPAAVSSGATFGLDTALLTITLIAVVLGAFVASPALGILVAVVAIPAYIRTLLAMGRRRAAGGRTDAVGKIEVFFVSVAVMMVVIVAAVVAFFATCFPLGLAGVGLADETSQSIGLVVVLGAFGIGFAAAAVVAWLLLRWARRLY